MTMTVWLNHSCARMSHCYLIPLQTLRRCHVHSNTVHPQRQLIYQKHVPLQLLDRGITLAGACQGGLFWCKTKWKCFIWVSIWQSQLGHLAVAKQTNMTSCFTAIMCRSQQLLQIRLWLPKAGHKSLCPTESPLQHNIAWNSHQIHISSFSCNICNYAYYDWPLLDLHSTSTSE